ncbi:MAG: hypothetical protein LBV27_01355 [Oscillospiraceae bacterium]|jgi:hypothetical protein|nr:hypothetical protein [Oscillospiraceae bacterium]
MKEKFCVGDFVLVHKSDEFKKYKLNKDYTIFNKTVDDYRCYWDDHLCINLHDGFELADYIQRINEYLEWLNSDNCESKLVAYFSNFDNDYNGIEKKWYKELEVWGAEITIGKDGKFFCSITCNGSHRVEVLKKYIRDDEIHSMEYEDMGDAYS